MLMQFGFRWKILYLCISEEERAHRYGVFSSFLVGKKVVLHYELVISTLRRNFFLGVCGFSLHNIDGFFADVERLKVKRYLFSKPHFFSFEGGMRSLFSLVSNVPHVACSCE